MVYPHHRRLHNVPAYREHHRRETDQHLWCRAPGRHHYFPDRYIAGDVLTEVYGYSKARQVIWLGFLCNVIAVAAVWGGQILPAAPFWHGQEAYEQILGYTPRLLAASFAAI